MKAENCRFLSMQLKFNLMKFAGIWKNSYSEHIYVMHYYFVLWNVLYNNTSLPKENIQTKQEMQTYSVFFSR